MNIQEVAEFAQPWDDPFPHLLELASSIALKTEVARLANNHRLQCATSRCAGQGYGARALKDGFPLGNLSCS
jgi:hypothetical protein